MAITEVDKQSQPLSYDIGYWVARVASALIRDFTWRFASYGITPVQFRILELCFRGEADTVTELARVVVLDPSGVSRQVEQLRKMGLLARRRTPSDRRTVRLELTEKGRNLVPELIQTMQDTYDVTLDGLEQDDLDSLFEMLRSMFNNLEEHEARR